MANLNDLASEPSVKIVLWVGVGICITALALRLVIRIICFKRLLVEDYLMVLALSTIISIAAVLHTYLADIYLSAKLKSHTSELPHMAPPELARHLTAAWRAVGIAAVLSTLGIYTIKTNFMLFFYRLGHLVTAYAILWRIAVAAIAACGAVQFGVIPYDCLFEDMASMKAHCLAASRTGHMNSLRRANIAVDVLSDCIIIVFPTLILWKAGISLYQKLLLSCIFSLVAFTIAVTIVRGSVFGGISKTAEGAGRNDFDPSWMVFWLFIELNVSFIVACLVSFRSLWTSKRQNNKEHRANLERQQAIIREQQRERKIEDSTPIQKHSVMRRKWDSLLDTLADMEGTTIQRNTYHLHHTVPSGRMTVDFSKFGMPQESILEAKTSHSSRSNHGSYLNAEGGQGEPVQSEWMREPASSVSEYATPQHAEPLPSYHRPGTAV